MNERFERVSKGPQPSALYADTTEYHISRLERIWTEFVSPCVYVRSFANLYFIRYCDIIKLEPQSTLTNCCPARAENFLHWMLENYTVKKVSSVETYWHQLSQLYIKWTGHRMEPLLLKQIYVVSISSLMFSTTITYSI